MTVEPDRLTYLGGHDVGAIVGVHPWLSAVEVRALKRGELPPVEVTERMELGLLLEDGIVEAFTRRQPDYRVRRVGFVRHRDFDFLGGHPDRLLFHDELGKGILEVKRTSSAAGWGEPGTDDVPPFVAVQCQWYMGLTRASYAWVARLTDVVHLYRLAFDPELYGALVDAAVDFHRHHIEGGAYVEPDGSEAYRRELRRRYPTDLGQEIVATPEIQLQAEELRLAQATMKEADHRVEELKQRIMLAMGEASSLVGPGFHFTYRVEKGRPDWKAIATALLPTPELIEANTRDGARVFRPHYEGEPP